MSVKSATFLDKIVNSPYFKLAMEKGEKLLNESPNFILKLLRKVVLKVKEIGESKNISFFQTLNQYLLLLVQLIKSYLDGSYTQVKKDSLIKILAGLIYFVLPLDFIPDFLPIVGFADDFALIIWIISIVKQELDLFEKHLKK